MSKIGRKKGIFIVQQVQPIDENEDINNIYLLKTSKLVPKGTILCMKKLIYSRYNNKKMQLVLNMLNIN